MPSGNRPERSEASSARRRTQMHLVHAIRQLQWLELDGEAVRLV